LPTSAAPASGPPIRMLHTPDGAPARRPKHVHEANILVSYLQ